MVGYATKDISTASSIKDIDGKKGIITGYFAHFNSLDSDGDIIVPGAFAKTFKERGPGSAQPRIKYLRNHIITEPVGIFTELKEDATGAYYEAKAGTNFVGQDTIKMIESGIITEHSFGFDTVKKELKSNARYLQELIVWEGSALTAWGANERTGAAMLKSLGKDGYTEMLVKRSKAIELFCRNSSATDETIELLLLETKQLTQLIFDITTQPEIKSTVPDGIEGVLNTFIKSIK